MDLFYIAKINTSTIINNNFYIKSTFDLLRKNGSIVSLGDSQLLKFIRKIKDIDLDYKEIRALFEERNRLKSLDANKKNGKEISRIQNVINEKLFIPDLVSVKCDTTKKDYKKICKNRFTMNIIINNTEYKITYRRLCAGAGQLRRNTVLFVNQDIYDELEHIMMCGLTKNKIGKINLAKFNAYYSLYTSAINIVKTPRICVVDDYEYKLSNQNVIWIDENENGELDTFEKQVDIDVNAFDGAGIISPDMAKVWQENLKLDYLPASFIIRAPFIKGLVSIFDFHRFAKDVAHTDIIKDIYGNEYKVSDIDIILSKSQFKLWKKYDSFSQYMKYFNNLGHIFGVTRVTKKENDFMTTLNYQYIQTNNFTTQSIKELADYTADYLKKVMSGDKLQTMLLLVGEQEEDNSILDIENRMNSSIAKALMYNDEILKDTYIRKKISRTIEKKVKQAKTGKIYVEGSYDFTIPDLYAFCENAFGMDVRGLLEAGECWNKRWIDKGSPTVTLMRSPLVAPGENRKLDLCFDEKCKDWFRYIYSGHIYNIWDTTIISQSDGDYDGDIVLSTDNHYVLDAVDSTLPIVTYEKQKAPEQRISDTNFASIDVRSFNSEIGQITNLASTIISMLDELSEDSEEYKELQKRMNILRKSQGDAISFCGYFIEI